MSRKRKEKIPMNISENNGPKQFDEEIMFIINENVLILKYMS
ncbi:hypothetical protein [Staphylococcus haemolyticus]